MGLLWIGVGLVALVIGLVLLLWAVSSREGWRP
jgi:nitrogen fixation-related uncharacterized protein